MSARIKGGFETELPGLCLRGKASFSYLTIKPGVEAVAAVVLLLAVSPLIVLLALLVRITSRGSVFYTQERCGRNGRPFTIYKLRTMRVDSEPDGAVWCRPGDPRVTSVGRFLRWAHLDELPQLLNVVRGDMSLVGPRPERPSIIAELEEAFPDYQARHRVRPGITGLAQVLQAADTDLDSVRRKLVYDLHYAESAGLWMDLRIYFGTVLLFVGMPGRWIAALLRFPYEAPPAPAHPQLQPEIAS